MCICRTFKWPLSLLCALKKILSRLKECRNKNKDYQQLVQQVQSLEARLNLTIQENVDLRATIDIIDDEKNVSSSR